MAVNDSRHRAGCLRDVLKGPLGARAHRERLPAVENAALRGHMELVQYHGGSERLTPPRRVLERPLGTWGRATDRGCPRWETPLWALPGRMELIQHRGGSERLTPPRWMLKGSQFTPPSAAARGRKRHSTTGPLSEQIGLVKSRH